MSENIPDSDAPAWDPVREGKRVLLELQAAEGGAYTVEEACALLGISRDTLKALHAAKDLVAWVDERGAYRFPRWQFRGATVLPGIGACLKHLGDDPGVHLGFFLAAAASDKEPTPLALIREGQSAAACDRARTFLAKG